MQWSLSEISQYLQHQGLLQGPAATDDVWVGGICTDTRRLPPGSLYVPLRGRRYDGHDYLLEAVRKGACACLSEECVSGLAVPVLQVTSTLQALGVLANGYRQQLNCQVAAITGSAGKTSCKEMLARILAEAGEVHRSPGNFNNLVGLPLSILQAPSELDYLVLEMGMNAPGEIEQLTQMAAPDVGIITNVGPAHLQGVGDLDGVARAKGALWQGLAAQGSAVVNRDDPRVASLPLPAGVASLTFGMAAGSQVRAENLVVDSAASRFWLATPWGRRDVLLPVSGYHQVSNALAAAAAALIMGASLEAVAAGLEAFAGVAGRLEPVFLPQGALLLDDSYNANPLSFQAALAVLAQAPVTGKRWAVLGDMLELGERAAQWHAAMGEEAGKHAHGVFFVGDYARDMALGARRAGCQQVEVLDSAAAAGEALLRCLAAEDVLLLKGSRALALEQVRQRLLSAEAAPGLAYCTNG